MLAQVLFGVKLFFEAVVGLILSGLFTSAIRSIFHLNTGKAVGVPEMMEQASKEGWIHRCLVALDIVINVILLRGQQDETISSHSWRAMNGGKLWGRAMCWWLNLFQENHGFKAACGDLERATVRCEVLKKALGV